MKKITACIGAILVVLGCSAFAFQGMAVRFSHWDEFKNIEHVAVEDISQKNYDIPDDWQEYSMNGISFTAPSGLEYDENDGCYTDVLSTDEKYRSNANARNIYIFGGELSQLGEDSFRPLKDLGDAVEGLTTPDELKDLCDWSGREYPQDGIDFVLLGADLNMDDFNIHSYKNAKTFFEIGDELANWGNLGSVRHYKLNTDRCKAYVVQIVRKEPLNFDPFASIRLLDSDGREAHLNVSTGNEEYDMAVISTVKLN